MRKFSWWFFFILKCAKLVVILPLALAGVIALLISLRHHWHSWPLVVLLALYVAAEYFEALENFSNYSKTKNRKG